MWAYLENNYSAHGDVTVCPHHVRPACIMQSSTLITAFGAILLAEFDSQYLFVTIHQLNVN